MNYEKLGKEIKRINDHCFELFRQGVDIAPYTANEMLVDFIIKECKDETDFDPIQFKKLAGYEIPETKEQEISRTLDHLLSKQIAGKGY